MSTNIKKIAVISDTHLLAQSGIIDVRHPSNIENKITREQIKKLIKTAAKLHKSVANGEASEAHFVLNGDIFEYIYPLIEPEEVTKQAVDFFTVLAKRFPLCHFDYIHGNHDASKELNEQLNLLISDPASPNYVSNLSIHKTHCQIGDALFTHGDILLGEHPKDNDITPPSRLEDDARILQTHTDIKDHKLVKNLISMGAWTGSMLKNAGSAFSNLVGVFFQRKDLLNEAAAEISKTTPEKKSSRAKVNKFYTTIQRNIQSWVELKHPPTKDAQIMAGTLAKEHPELLETINHVFTGHRHIPYAHLEVEQGISITTHTDSRSGIHDTKEIIPLAKKLEFHNTGAPLAGAKFNPMVITMTNNSVNWIEIDKDLNKRIPAENTPKYEKKWAKYARKMEEETVNEWNKQVQKRGFKVDAPRWDR